MDNLNVIMKSKQCSKSGILKVTKDDLDNRFRASLKQVNEGSCNSSENKGMTLKGIHKKYDPKKEKGIVRFCLLSHGEGGIIKVGKTVFGHKLHGKEPLRIIEDSNQDSCNYLDKNDASLKNEILGKSRQVSGSNIVVLESANKLVDKRKLITSSDFLNLNLGYICLKNADSSSVDKIIDIPQKQVISEPKRKDFKLINFDVKKIQECQVLKSPVGSMSCFNTDKDFTTISTENVFLDHSDIYFDSYGLEEIVDGTSRDCQEVINESVEMCLTPPVRMRHDERGATNAAAHQLLEKESFLEAEDLENEIDKSHYSPSQFWRDSFFYEHSYSLLPPGCGARISERSIPNCSNLNIENSNKIGSSEYHDDNNLKDTSLVTSDINPQEAITQCSSNIINEENIDYEDLKTDSSVSSDNENINLSEISKSFSNKANVKENDVSNFKESSKILEDTSLLDKNSCSDVMSVEECIISDNDKESAINSTLRQGMLSEGKVKTTSLDGSTAADNTQIKTEKLLESKLLNLNRPGLVIKPLDIVNESSSKIIGDISIERLEQPLKDNNQVENEVSKNKISMSDRIESGDIIIEKITNLNNDIISYSQRDRYISTSGSNVDSLNDSNVNNFCNQVLLENDDLIIEKACPASFVDTVEDKASTSHIVDQLPCAYNTTISVIDKPLTNYDDYCTYSQKYDGFNSSTCSRKGYDVDMMYQLSAKMLTEEALRKQHEMAYQYYDPTYWRLYDNLRNILGPDIVDVYNNFIHFMIPESFAVSVQWSEFSKSGENGELPLSSVPESLEMNQSVLPSGPVQSEHSSPSSNVFGYPSPYCQTSYSPSDSPQSFDPTGQLTITPLDQDGKLAQGQPLSLPLHQQLTITPLANPQSQPYSQCTKLGTQTLRRRGRPPLDPEYDSFSNKKYFYPNYYSSYSQNYPSDLQPYPVTSYSGNNGSYNSSYNRNYYAPYLYRAQPPEMSFLTPQSVLTVSNYDLPPDCPPSPPSLIPLAKDPFVQSSLASDVSLSPIPNSVAQNKLRNSYPPENIFRSSSVASLTPKRWIPHHLPEVDTPFSKTSQDDTVQENDVSKKLDDIDTSSSVLKDSNGTSQNEVDSDIEVEVESLYIDEPIEDHYREPQVDIVSTNVESFESDKNEISNVNTSNESKNAVQDSKDIKSSLYMRENCAFNSFTKSKNIESILLTNISVLGNKSNIKRMKRKKKLLTLNSKKKLLSISRSGSSKKISSLCKSNKLKSNNNKLPQGLDQKSSLNDKFENKSLEQSVDCSDEFIKATSPEMETKNEDYMSKENTQESLKTDSVDDSGVRRSGRKRKIIEGNPKFRDMERVDLSKALRLLEKIPIKKKKSELKVKPFNKVLNKRLLEEKLNERQAKENKLKEELKRKDEERRRKEEIEKKRIEDRERKQTLMLKQFHEMNDIYLKPQTFF